MTDNFAQDWPHRQEKTLPPKLLIVNPYHEKYMQIPMGAFGLCDYLTQAGIEARMINMSLYPYPTHETRLRAELSSYRPDMAGIVLHWKETLESSLHLAFMIKRWFPGVPVVMGGLTAGYFAEDLLDFWDEVDFVVRGDAERALELLLRRSPPSEIPNLAYRGEDEEVCFGP